MTVVAIERRILTRLAQRLRRDPEELETELRLADEALPVEPDDLRPTLSALESDLGVRVPQDLSCLSYVRELAIAIQAGMLYDGSRVSARRSGRGGNGGELDPAAVVRLELA